MTCKTVGPVQWREPGEKSRIPSIWTKRLRAFHRNPGRWGVIPGVKTRQTWDQAKRKIKAGEIALPGNTSLADWEFAVRVKLNGNGHDVYARYNPQQRY